QLARGLVRKRFQFAAGNRDDATWSAHPEVAARVFSDEMDFIAGQTGFSREPGQRAIFQQKQSCAVCSDPELAFGIFMQCPDLLAAKAIKRGISDERACLQSAQASVGRDPQVAVSIR